MSEEENETEDTRDNLMADVALGVSGFGAPDDDDEPAAVPLAKLTGKAEPPYVIPRGKYKGITLPRMVGIKPTMLDKVQAVQAEIIADPEFQRHAGTIAQTYAALRLEAEELAATIEEAKIRLAAVQQLMIDQYEVEDTLSIGVRNVGTIRVQPEPHAIIMDKELCRQWCLKNGLEHLMVVPWGTLNRITKEMLLDHRGEPEGITAFMRPKVVFSREAHLKRSKGL